MENITNDKYAKSFVEILEIVKFMGKKYEEKIPSKLLNLFENQKDCNYKYQINSINDITGGKISNETIGLLALIELKYWATPEDKQLLEQSLYKNEEEYQRKLREKYNPDKLFENQKKEEIREDHVEMVEYKESIYEKIKKWFKHIFKKIKKE